MATPTTSEIFNSAIQTLYELNADERIRQQCRAREEAERHERTLQKKLADNEKTIVKLKQENQTLKSDIQNLQNENSSLRDDIQNIQNEFATLRTQLKLNNN